MKRGAAAVLAFLMALVGATGLPNPATASTVQSANTVAEILSAPDYSFQAHAPKLRLYQAIFDRTPDVGGAKYWIDINNQGHDVLAIAGFMSGSAEWTNNYAGTSDREFLTRVYSNVLGRDFDQGGFNYWLDTLLGTNSYGGNPEFKKLDRSEVVFYITANPEFTSAYPFASTYVPPAAPAGTGGKLTLRQWQAPSGATIHE